jgi:hypothetical protein
MLKSHQLTPCLWQNALGKSGLRRESFEAVPKVITHQRFAFNTLSIIPFMA